MPCAMPRRRWTRKRLLGAPQDAFVKTFAKSRTKAAVFDLGGTEFVIRRVQPDPDGRFAAWTISAATKGCTTSAWPSRTSTPPSPKPGQRRHQRMRRLQGHRQPRPPRRLGRLPSGRRQRHRNRIHAGV
ncbi:MAG: hypothetical protein R2856_15655 [Caldilineaceae bacterium]